MKMVRTEVRLTEDRSTFIGYHYYLHNEKSHHAFKLYSSFNENSTDLDSENQHDPKDCQYHDAQAALHLKLFIDKLMQSTHIANETENTETNDLESREHFMNKQIKSF
jgi:hypothetical protein